MKSTFLVSMLACLAVLSGCSSSSDSAAEGPVIDALDVPATATSMTVDGQTGPGVTLTLTAHDDSAGLSVLHAVFTETNTDQAIDIPGAPTTLTAQKIALVVLNAPSGAHPIAFRLTDSEGRDSTVVDATITVP